MHSLKKHPTLVLAALGILVSLLLAGQGTRALLLLPHAPGKQHTRITIPTLTDADRPFLPEATRLRSRLAREDKPLPHILYLIKAIRERNTLLSQSLNINFSGNVSTEVSVEPWVVLLQHYPQWLSLETTPQSAQFTLNPESIRQTVSDELSTRFPPPIDSIITGVAEKNGILYAETSTIAKAGYVFDNDALTSLIISALTQEQPELSIPLEWREGSILSATPDGATTLVLLSSGQSNFSGSPAARKYNITKAIQEHLNGIIIPAGETFSFNATLGGPIMKSTGWQEALGIFNGDQLEPTPGGGICQTSTTLYRAVAHGGFPILERRNHSLYVSYYEKYGIGLDAAVFPGVKDLKFINDTNNPLFIQSFIDAQEVTMNIYGIPTGRRVTLEGPYFKPNAPKDLLIGNRPIQNNEIAWIQHIARLDGTTEKNLLVSRYGKGIPSSVIKKHIADITTAKKDTGSPFAASLLGETFYHFQDIIEDIGEGNLQML